MDDFGRMLGPDDFGKTKYFIDGRRETVSGIDRRPVYNVFANDDLFHRQCLGLCMIHASGRQYNH
jgi:hypothetical protein